MKERIGLDLGSWTIYRYGSFQRHVPAVHFTFTFGSCSYPQQFAHLYSIHWYSWIYAEVIPVTNLRSWDTPAENRTRNL